MSTLEYNQTSSSYPLCNLNFSDTSANNSFIMDIGQSTRVTVRATLAGRLRRMIS